MFRIAALTLLLVASCSSEQPSTGGSPFESFATTSPRVGEPAPPFELVDTTGTIVKLSEATARGPVVLVFGSFT